MDFLAIIEAILRALAGETGTPDRQPPSSEGKSLDEILERVREEARRKRAEAEGQASAPSAPPAPRPASDFPPLQPVPPVAPQMRRAPQPQAQARPPRPREGRAAGRPQPVAPVPAVPQRSKRRVQDVDLAPAPAAPLPSGAQPVAGPAQRAGRAAVSEITAISAPGEAAQEQKSRFNITEIAGSGLGAQPGQPTAASFVSLLRATPAPVRLQFARQAFVLQEVFGPPRSLRPYRPQYLQRRPQ